MAGRLKGYLHNITYIFNRLQSKSLLNSAFLDLCMLLLCNHYKWELIEKRFDYKKMVDMFFTNI